MLHTELHWLDVPERVKYKLSVMVHSCLKAPQYLTDFCTPLSAVTSRQRLRSTSRQLLDVPRYRVLLADELFLWQAHRSGLELIATVSERPGRQQTFSGNS